MNRIMIKVENVSKWYGELQVLNNICLQVMEGEVVVLIGPSGSGKTTLLRCIHLLEPFSAGKIYVSETLMGYHEDKGKLRRDSEKELNRKRGNIGMIFQSFNLFSNMTVLQNVMEGPITVLRMPKDQARKIAIDLVRKVGLEDKIDNFPSRLSGGQKQRVAIARALAMDPKVLLIDEPTSSLDPELIEEVLDTLKRLASEGITMLIVTHELGFARDVADRICFFYEGQIHEEGPAKEFLSNPQKDRTRLFLKTILQQDCNLAPNNIVSDF